MSRPPRDRAATRRVREMTLFVAVDDGAGELVGFFRFRGSPADGRIGLGLAPNGTGRGLGEGFVRAGLAFAQRRWGARCFTLDVASFNQRAIKVYRRIGFAETRRHGRP